MKDVLKELSCKYNLDVVNAIFERAVELARQYEQEGTYDAFISGGSNVSVLREHVEVPVVSFKVTGFDLLRSILHIRKQTDRVSVISFKQDIPELDEIRELLNTDIEQYAFTTEKELEEQIIKLKNERCGIVSTSLVCYLAEKYQIPNKLIYSRRALIEAVESAYEMALSKRREMDRAKSFKTIIDFAYSGIIAMDEKGTVTVFNPEAERIMGKVAESVIGKPIHETVDNPQMMNVLNTGVPELNQIYKIGDTEILINKVPIMVNNSITGAVATFQDVATIQKAEAKIRQNLFAKGFVAKYSFHHIIGKSTAMRQTVERAKQFAFTNSTILIRGESGTGKELFAQSIHNHSVRKHGPFVAVNCAALSESLLESELFGYDQGAFTGARKEGKIGLFELAHGGTIFLDEVTEIPLSVQSRLLRVLQQREVMRVGSDRIIPVDIRVIAATNRDIKKLVQENKFREDLFYRINVLELHLPPLRARKEDFADLIINLVRKHNPNKIAELEALLPRICSRLASYDWPGNIRELENMVERFLILVQHWKIEHWETLLHEALYGVEWEKGNYNHSLMNGVAGGDTKCLLYERVLRETGGNKSEAARRLGVSRMTLWRYFKNNRKE
jgi:propionate catabolism operon transcriptional regulator